MGLPAGEGHTTEADQRLGRQGGQAGMARGGKMAAALQPARPACRIGDANLGRSWHRCRAAQLRRWSSCGPTALAWCEQVAMQLAQAAVQRQLRGGGQTAAVLGLDEGQGLTTLLSAGPQLRQGLQQALELGLRLAKPGLEIHHGQRQCGGSSVQWLQVVTPPELLGAIQVHPSYRAVAAYQRTGHLGRITHRQEQAQGNPQLGGNIQPKGQESAGAGILDRPGADLAGDLRSQEIGQLRPYRPRGGMLQPALGQGQAALGGGPPAIQINQQPLLQRRQLLPLEISLGVVMIGSDQFTGQLHPKALQQ